MASRLLPIGIQTFREIRERDCYYVDKTGYACQLVEQGKHYFLSRPRRFGKSLFLDTLKDLFEGSRELFEGLEACDRWDWSEWHPVIRLSFGSGDFKEAGYLHKNLSAQLSVLEAEAGVEPCFDTGPERLSHLVRCLHQQADARVAVLVDEYDKPIVDALEEPAQARANRDYLRGLYATIKECDAHIRFSFLTGVSKFSKVSLFSGLNNLRDITLNPSYSTICGYRESDLDTVFAPELEGLDRERVRDWYNGYSWGGAERVYNPFDVLLLLADREFNAWWFETGTPRFLVETLVDRAMPTPALNGLVASSKLLSSFDVDYIATEALLFQTGYLTVLRKETHDEGTFYTLGFPNREVRQGLNASLLQQLVPDRSTQAANSVLLAQLLRAGDLEGLDRLLRSLFAGIPHDWHRRNEIARFEGYYASVFYSFFAGAGLDVTVEDSSSDGRLDMVARTGARVYLFEFKVQEQAGPGTALKQLKERGYATKYRHLELPIHLVGVEFSAETRNVARLETELA